MLIAIDGPAGAGKSTVARALARRLGFGYLDSGAMYRAVGLLSLDAPEREPGELAREAPIELSGTGPDQEPRVLLGGRDVSDAIRTPAASVAASRVAADPAVRATLVARQRALIEHGDWVVEGRDIGSAVAPQAELKVFLTASAEERTRRRAAELGLDAAQLRHEQAARDERDSSRAHSPLRAAPDAVQIDTDGLSAAQVVAQIATLASERRAG